MGVSDQTQRKTGRLGAMLTDQGSNRVGRGVDKTASYDSPSTLIAKAVAWRSAGGSNGRLARLTPGEALGRYLQTWHWHHFLTLTTAWRTSETELRTLFQAGMIRRLARVAQRPIAYFFAIERAGNADPRPHIHALIAGTDLLTVDRIRLSWRHGYGSVRRYDPRRDAALYSTKDLLLDPDSYDFSRRPPACRVDADAVAIRAMLDTASLRWR